MLIVYLVPSSIMALLNVYMYLSRNLGTYIWPIHTSHIYILSLLYYFASSSITQHTNHLLLPSRCQRRERLQLVCLPFRFLSTCMYLVLEGTENTNTGKMLRVPLSRAGPPQRPRPALLRLDLSLVTMIQHLQRNPPKMKSSYKRL